MPDLQKEKLTLRSVLIGLFMVTLINVGAPYSLYVLHSSMWAISYLPLSVMFFFFLLVVGNLLLTRFRERTALTPTELTLIFIMSLVGSSIPTWGTASYLVAVVAAPYYFASPENQWAEYILRYLPSWIAPKDATVLKWFFDGIPKGEHIPWGAWLTPLFWWTSFVLTVFFLCHCLAAVFRKQWSENERLPFALMEVPQEMIESPSHGSSLPSFLTKRALWAGFAIPLFIVLWNVVTYFQPGFPRIKTTFAYVSLGRNFPYLVLAINFAVVAFTFFIHLEVAFSLWVFVTLSMLEEGIFNRFGFIVAGRDVYTLGHPAIGWQSFGAMIVMVVNLFWMARRHLRDIILKAWSKDHEADDSDELMSYRSIVVGIILSIIYIVAWLRFSGMSFLVLTVFLFSVLVLYIGVTRIVIEGGLLFIRGPLVSQTFTAFTLGSASMSGQSMASLAISYSWLHELKGFFMPASAHAGKLTDSMRISRRSVSVCILLAAVVGMVVSIWFTVYMGHRYGALNYGSWIFGYGAQAPYIEIVRKIRVPSGPDMERLLFMGIGVVGMIFLTLMHYRFSWWPLHPIGLPVAICSYPVNHFVFSIFVGWAIKWIIMKTGGNHLYYRARPFFIGVILGFFTGIGISFIIDMIWFPGRGHPLYGY